MFVDIDVISADLLLKKKDQSHSFISYLSKAKHYV